MTIKEKINLEDVEEYLAHEEEFMALSDEDASAEGYEVWEREMKKKANEN